MFEYLTTSAVIVVIYMSLVFLLALILKDNSIVDIFRGPGFIFLAIPGFASESSIDFKQLLVNTLVIIWGLRLTIHLYIRNRGKGEGFIYANQRLTWKHFILRSFFQIFMLQGLFILIISWPVLHINYCKAAEFGMIDIAGLLIFITGFIFEALGDYQLQEFKKDIDNKRKIMTTGLWKYTRHPNYFGEALLWWGIWLMAVPVVDGIYTIAGPILITLLLRYLTGIPELEKKWEGRTGWEEYKAGTPVFIPFLNMLKGK